MSYILLPTSRPKDHPDSPLDSKREVHALHHDPSPHFCALRRRPLVCAHGGDVETAPPNTLASFNAALEGGADCVEVDVSMTKDGHLVALHDRDLAMLLERSGAAAGIPWQPPKGTTTTHRRNLLSRWRRRSVALPRAGEYTWDQLRRLEWEPRGPRIATFQSVLSMVLPHRNKVAITVDVKLRESLDESEEAETMAQAVFDTLRSIKCGKRCMIWAKSDKIAASVKALDSAQRVGLVVMNETNAARAAGMDKPLRLGSLGIEVAGVHYGMANHELAHQLRSAQREVHVWTANSASMMRIALDAGPDAVVTNHPKKLIAALRARAEACQRRHHLDKEYTM